MNLLRKYIRGLLSEEMLTLHHRTSPDKAAVIRQAGFDSKIKTSFGTEVYFSTKPDGEATGYGTELVSIEIPERYANLDDEFPDGEQHYWVAAKDLSQFGRLLSEQNVLAIGMCFPFAYQKAEEWFKEYFTPGRPGRKPKRHPDLNDKNKFKVVHGTVTDKWKSPPKPVVHGWVEMGDLVFDDQTKIMKPDGISKDVYYDMYQPEVFKEFTAEEAIINCAVKGGEGPWDDDLLAQVQQRDAWRDQ